MKQNNIWHKCVKMIVNVCLIFFRCRKRRGGDNKLLPNNNSEILNVKGFKTFKTKSFG